MQRLRMGSKRLDSIGDYGRWGFNLQVKCRRCRHVAELDSMALAMACVQSRKSSQMFAIQRRLRCTRCRARDVICGPIPKRPPYGE